jgi:hypothetical protein
VWTREQLEFPRANKPLPTQPSHPHIYLFSRNGWGAALLTLEGLGAAHGVLAGELGEGGNAGHAEGGHRGLGRVFLRVLRGKWGAKDRILSSRLTKSG